jgi:succinyl-CoA synthetase alpha subunit
MGGSTAPKGTKMGHAGAIVTAGKGTVEDKVAALEGVGALVAGRPSEIGELLQSVLARV